MKLRTVLILAAMMLGGMLLSGVALAKDKTGDSKPNTLMGTKNPDYIRGKGGGDDIGGKQSADYLYGNMGNDLLHGGDGNDFVYGDKGDNDVVYGDAGNDKLWAESETQGSYQAAKVKGGRKPDRLLGGSGNDTIRAKDGTKDIIRGGPGYDKAYVDKVDKVQGVEKKFVPGGGGTGGGPQQPKQCEDGKDNDGDGKTDFGTGANNDPGCASAKDDTEKNQPPVAKKDSYSVVMDRDIEEPAPGVLENDKDVDGDSLTAELVTGPSCNASGRSCGFTLNPDGSFTYISRSDVYTDSFTYKATDGAPDSDVATVTINVVCDPNGDPNDPYLPPECQ